MKTKIGLIVGLILCLVSCGKMYEYKHLDGMWQMRSIEYEDGTEGQLENVYYSFQKHTVNIRKIGADNYLGNFAYKGDSLLLQTKTIPEDRLSTFGLNSVKQHFYVEKLTSDEMILKSVYARLEFRKY